MNNRPQPVRWRPSQFNDSTKPTAGFYVAVALVAAAWFSLAGLVLVKSSTVGSSDEAANRLFISQVARTGQAALPTGLPSQFDVVLKTPSIIVQQGKLLPGSFLAFVQIGAAVQRIVGPMGMPVLTLLVNAAGLWCLFLVFRRFWGRWWSFLGIMLLAFHPAVFTFATLPYLHNGLFVGLLLISGLLLLRTLEYPTWQRSLMFGAVFGVALAVRPIEVLWAGPVVLVVLTARRLWRESAIIVGMVAIVQLPWLIFGYATYGSILASGYAPEGILTANTGGHWWDAMLNIITPPGGWSWHWLSSTWWYFILFTPAWSAMGLVALARYFRKKYVTWQKSAKLTLILAIGAIPFVYYGSWNLYPNIPATTNGALASYVRYWLPMFVVLAPGVIMTLRLLTRRWHILAATACLLIGQIGTLWFQPVAGIAAHRRSDQQHLQLRDRILEATPANAVVFSARNGKYILDERLTGFALPTSDTQWTTFRALVQLRPTYLVQMPGEFSATAVTNELQQHQLSVELIPLDGGVTLWHIITS